MSYLDEMVEAHAVQSAEHFLALARARRVLSPLEIATRFRSLPEADASIWLDHFSSPEITRDLDDIRVDENAERK